MVNFSVDRKLSRPLPATPSKLVQPREDLRKFPWFREISRADAECEVAIGLYQNYFAMIYGIVDDN